MNNEKVVAARSMFLDLYVILLILQEIKEIMIRRPLKESLLDINNLLAGEYFFR